LKRVTSHLRPSTAFFGALARIFFAAGGGATLKADTLAAATGGQVHAGQWLGCGGGFAVCFGDDLVAHLRFLIKLKCVRILGHCLRAAACSLVQ